MGEGNGRARDELPSSLVNLRGRNLKLGNQSARLTSSAQLDWVVQLRHVERLDLNNLTPYHEAMGTTENIADDWQYYENLNYATATIRPSRCQLRRRRVAPRVASSHGIQGQALVEPVVRFHMAAPVQNIAVIERPETNFKIWERILIWRKTLKRLFFALQLN